MDKLIELLQQIQDLAGVAIDALQGAEGGGEGEAPGEGGGNGEGAGSQGPPAPPPPEEQ